MSTEGVESGGDDGGIRQVVDLALSLASSTLSPRRCGVHQIDRFTNILCIRCPRVEPE